MNNILWAVEQMQAGNRVGRTAWNGNGTWLAFLQVQNPTTGILESKLFKKTSRGILVPWLCTKDDLTAVDWVITNG